MDILLVVGNSTATQYEPLKAAMIADGLTPEVVHFRTPVRKCGVNIQLLNDILDLRENPAEVAEWSEAEFKQWRICRSDEIQTENFIDTLENYSVKDIKAALYPYNASEGEEWNWLARTLPETIASYQVMQAENSSSQYLLGVGYGPTLDVE